MLAAGLDLGDLGGLVILKPSRVEGYLAQCVIALTLRRLNEFKYQETIRAAIEFQGVKAIASEKVLNFGRRTIFASQMKYRGLVRSVCWERGVKHFEYAAKTVKKAITGNGNASKEEMIKAVNRLIWFDVPVEDDHIADAAGLALLLMSREGSHHGKIASIAQRD